MSNADLEVLEETKDLEEESQPEKIEKPKKPRTQKQIEAFEKARKVRDEKRSERKEVKVKAETEYKKVKEEKIVKKALAIKKKQIIQDADLDAISEDDIPVEVIKKIMTRKKAAPKAVVRPNTPEPIKPSLSFI
jgi:hypothetical protein